MNKSICLICEVKLAVHIMCLTGRFRTELCSIWTCWWKSWSRSPWPRWPLPLYTWQRSSLVTSCRAGVGLTSTASGKPHTHSWTPRITSDITVSCGWLRRLSGSSGTVVVWGSSLRSPSSCWVSHSFLLTSWCGTIL